MCTKERTGAVAVRAALASAVPVGRGNEGNRQAEMANPAKCRDSQHVATVEGMNFGHNVSRIQRGTARSYLRLWNVLPKKTGGFIHQMGMGHMPFSAVYDSSAKGHARVWAKFTGSRQLPTRLSTVTWSADSQRGAGAPPVSVPQ
jgi:hypothetical protein